MVYVHTRGWYNKSNPEYHRNFAIITSLGCIKGSASPNKHLDSVFASQGYIAHDGSTVKGLIEEDRGNIRGCYWTARQSDENDKEGELLQFRPLTKKDFTGTECTYSYGECGNNFYTIKEVYYSRFSNVLFYHRMNTPLVINKFVASRAQPVRCIQEPNN